MSSMGLASVHVADAASSFKMICIGLLDTAYSELYAAKVVTRDFDENAISEALVYSINANPETIKMSITAITEKKLLPDGLQNALPTVDDANRIDIMIGGFGWSREKYRTECYMEAKNLYCQSFTKTGNKSITSPGQYAQRYINTGIDNLLNGHYPSDTLLLGYVLVGTVKEAVDLLNQYLEKRTRSTEMIAPHHYAEFPHLQMGRSIHPNGMTLEHCFLSFYLML